MIKLEINGAIHELDADPQMPLLWALRDKVGLTGTKYGCGIAQCGACTVYLDGEPVRACVTPISGLSGKSITSIEGLDSAVGRAVLSAWDELDVAQCGYCQPGQVMSAAALLEANTAPSDGDIDAAMSGNICRCATYVRIREAIKQAAGTLREKEAT